MYHNSTRRKSYHMASSTSLKYGPTSGLMLCTKWHSCWSDLWILAYSGCRCLCATLDNVLTTIFHHFTFSPFQSICVTASPREHPRYLPPITSFSPILLKNSLYRGTFLAKMNKMLFVGSGKYLWNVPCRIQSSRWDFIFPRFSLAS